MTSKQTKAEKRLYAKIRYSKKQAKAATRQGGYWRDIPGAVDPMIIERRETRITLHPGKIQIWVRPDGKELLQVEHKSSSRLSTIAKSHRREASGVRNITRERARVLLFRGERPPMSAADIAAYRLAAKEYMATLPLHYDGNRARAAAAKRQARRLIRQWGGNPDGHLDIALTLLHGPETAVRIARQCGSMTAALRIDANEGRTQSVGYWEKVTSIHHMARADEEAGQTSYLHCIRSRWCMESLLRWCWEIAGKPK